MRDDTPPVFFEDLFCRHFDVAWRVDPGEGRGASDGGGVPLGRGDARLQRDGAQGPDRRSVEVRDPEGKEMEAYAQNAVAEGLSCEVVIPFSLNGAPGDRGVTVRDVVTGVTAETEVRVGE